MDIVTLAIAKKFTKDTADSLGSLRGAPATVKSIAEITGGHRVTLSWTGTSGAEQTQSFDVMDGERGPQGEKGADGTMSFDDLTPEQKATLKGDPGEDGAPGQDGYSPSVAVADITGGHRVTITDATGDHVFDVMDGQGGEGAAVLSAKLTASKTVGGITSGKEYAKNTPLETIFRDMLNPVEVPALTNPTATISANGGNLVEDGGDMTKTLTIAFNRGSINPKYGTSGNRSGAATGYALNNGAVQTGNSFTVTVSESNKTFTGTVNYAAGEQPKNSAGENYGEPLAAGSVNTNTLTLEIVAALWSNAANITTVAKETLISKTTKQKQFNFPEQTQANPEIFDVPASWTVTAVELLNTLNNQWVDDMSEFTVTDTTHGSIAYKRYTYNGGDATGARSIRVKWS